MVRGKEEEEEEAEEQSSVRCDNSHSMRWPRLVHRSVCALMKYVCELVFSVHFVGDVANMPSMGLLASSIPVYFLQFSPIWVVSEVYTAS